MVRENSIWERCLTYATSIQLDIEKVMTEDYTDENAASIIFSHDSIRIYFYDHMPEPLETRICDLDAELVNIPPRKAIKKIELPFTDNQYHQLEGYLKQIKCEPVIELSIYTVNTAVRRRWTPSVDERELSIYAVDTVSGVFYRVRLYIDMSGYDDPMLYIDTQISQAYRTESSSSIFNMIKILISHLPDSNAEVRSLVNNLGISPIPINDTHILFNNRYRLYRKVGEGGYGMVWHACDTFNDTEVAIKIYKSSVPFDIMERARKEYAIGRSLYHLNILPLYDLNYCVESLYIVMPYCSFGSIDKLCGKVSEQVVWRIIKDISSGLEYLHNCGIMHLDIKPANILFDSQSRYVISDFGLSHRAADLILFYDKAMTFGGTAYLAPERFDSNMRIDTYSDIWSLGVSIYELVTGELPFHGWGGKQQLADRILSLKCDKCSKELSNLIDACISPYPQNRPSATEIIALADAVIAGQSDIPLFNILSDDSILKSTYTDTGYFYNTYNGSVLNAMKCFKIAKSTDKSLYGIVDDNGKVIVDFLYDEIHNIGEYCWPGPGPLPPKECFFIGAFFRQGDDAGYLIIKDDGNMGEYRRCSYEEYVRRCQFS